jgi:hypothetical protein
VVIPGLVVVVDDSSAQAPGRVDAGAGDRDGGQVDHEHREPDWERSKHLNEQSTSAKHALVTATVMMMKFNNGREALS